MVVVNLMIVTSKTTEEREIELPAVPQVGDCIVFEEGDNELALEVNEVTYRIRGTSGLVVVTLGELD